MELKLLFCLLLYRHLYISYCEILHVSENEGNTAILHCGKLTKGKVTWSREVNGQGVDILTTHNGDTTKHITDPDKHYSSGSYLSLIIYGVSRPHAGKYYCNGTAVELTVRSASSRPSPLTTMKKEDTILWIPYSVHPTTEMRSDDPLTTESSFLDSDPSTTTTDGVRVNMVERVLMFGGVGLAALMFLLATVAAGRVILHQNRQTSWKSDRDTVQLRPSE
ncbi:hypothetical protein MHYP_G00173360 [Metynnis hypsauchen]